MTYTVGNVSGLETLTDADDIYPSHVNELRTYAQKKTFVVVGLAEPSDYLCDGVADNVQLQAAHDSLPSTGGIIFIRKGTYEITTNVKITKSNVSIFGEQGVNLQTITGTWTPAIGGAFTIGFSASVSNIVIRGIKFTARGTASAIVSTGHINLKILECEFTGDTTIDGVVRLYGGTPTGKASFYNTLIKNNYFHDIQNANHNIYVYANNGNLVYNTTVEGNFIENIQQNFIYLDSQDYIYNTNIVNNHAREIRWKASPVTYGNLVYTGAFGGYWRGLNVIGNTMYNSALNTNELVSFGSFYIGQNLNIKNNIAIVPNGIAGDFLNLGRLTSPIKNVNIEGNICQGFHGFWDPDSMVRVNVANNQIINCGYGLGIGYGTQEHVKIHDNIVYNPIGVYVADLLSFIYLASSTPIDCDIYDNDFVDEQSPSIITRFIGISSGYDRSKVRVRGNRVYIPNRALTMIYNEGVGAVPRINKDNHIQDINGMTDETDVYNVGTTSGNITFDRANGGIQTCILNGASTAIIIGTTASAIGDTLELRVTQDAVGGRTLAWPANFKKVGGSLNLSVGANAVDVIKMRYNRDFDFWYEVSRSLNLS